MQARVSGSGIAPRWRLEHTELGHLTHPNHVTTPFLIPVVGSCRLLIAAR